MRKLVIILAILILTTKVFSARSDDLLQMLPGNKSAVIAETTTKTSPNAKPIEPDGNKTPNSAKFSPKYPKHSQKKSYVKTISRKKSQQTIS